MSTPRLSPTLWMIIAVIAFCLMAIGIRELDDKIDSVQIIFYRSFIGLIALGVLFRNKINLPNWSMIKNHMFRNIFHILGQYGWIVGILHLSLAEVTAIEFSVPIWILIIAALFLKEKLTTSKIISMLLGFGGVLVIIKPGIEMINTSSTLVLLSAISYAIAHISTKQLTKTYNPLDIVFMMCIIQAPISFCLAIPTLIPPTFKDISLLIIISLSALSAHFAMSKAMKQADISAIISIDYLRLPILIIIGILFYKETFEPIYLIGGMLIILGNWVNLKKGRLTN